MSYTKQKSWVTAKLEIGYVHENKNETIYYEKIDAFFR